LHVALPLGAGAGIWIHVSRLARPTLLPPKPLLWGALGAFFVLAVFLPAPLPAKANPLFRRRCGSRCGEPGLAQSPRS
jgi:hypothetical protein